ncbi:chloramphenicol acetyltransferase [Marivirga lumbricoides]|uniref:Chloramphenicol acetyltransferase n=1 Tax=Marivirga lumbricoides TaxID=1046115 RepID=A0ABQ1LDI8_9BACT|nr:chloramphenicol acetyltransferase [Marivirga lumbricoides]
MKKIDLNSYPRKEHFEFFGQFDEPFFGLTVEIDCAKATQFCKEEKISFYQFYTFQILKAVNEVPELRHRLIDGEIFDMEEVHVSSTVLRDNKTFGFSKILYKSSFAEFAEGMKEETERVRNSSGLQLIPGQHDVIHYTATPWLHFTSISHARHFKFKDSIPKLAVGKAVEKEGKRMMPVSIHAHHALVDGYHVGLFYEKLSDYLHNPNT